jgi:ADP-ribose pyrophosphatase YjhB (NUDIX family)
MNKKLYFHDKFICFENAVSQNSQNQAFINSGEETFRRGGELRKKVTDFLAHSKGDHLFLQESSFKDFLYWFRADYHYIEAAGGLISQNDKYLFIRRHDRWDLPKGKLEKGESPQKGAVRECEEECGISGLSIIRQLQSTFHIYEFKRGLALKQSYWYLMDTTFSGKLKPQTEEDITEVRWFSKQEISSVALRDTYHTVRDLVTDSLGILIE